MANRLASETSPYLLQHKDNPVDWYPWGDEAFAKAQREDKPVFLSIGYSSCHWCHVMEHESFENDEIATILNASFVSVKVDREERPDIDEAYMTAVQLSTGRGGWPMTVFLTPDKKPFFAGTYFPRENRGQHPGFQTICAQIASLWKAQRAELQDNAAEFALGLAEAMGRTPPPSGAKLDEGFLSAAVRALALDFDNEHGGFGGAPKFPPHTSIDFLLRYAMRLSAPEDLREVALGMALSTLEQMALGGIHDHVGGGFHRYSTDDHWLVPHFEKMLYDNALMLSNYTLGAIMVHAADPRLAATLTRAAQGIVVWTILEMTSSDGLFCSALDADSEGKEGKFYVWSMEEIREALGDRATVFSKAFQLREEGNFEDEATGRGDGSNIPHLTEPLTESFEAELTKLREVRSARVRPGTDDKALVSWNGLMIAAFARAGILDRAEAAARKILEAERELGELPHQIVQGVASGKGFLEDYASLALALFELSGEMRVEGPWLAEAERLTRRMIDLFWDETDAGFFATSSGHEELFGRSKPVFDSPVPSANAMALKCLVEIGDLDRANRLAVACLGWMEKAPQATEALLAGALALVEEGIAAEQPKLEAPKGDVSVRLEPREIHADAEGLGRGAVIIDIPAGLHLNDSDPPARWLIPTALRFQPLEADVSYPKSTDYAYEGKVTIPFSLRLPTGSSGEEFEVSVTFQACTDTECLAPQEKVLSGVVLKS
jgi:uncharacterized protein YyaL (SSP411 family)